MAQHHATSSTTHLFRIFFWATGTIGHLWLAVLTRHTHPSSSFEVRPRPQGLSLAGPWPRSRPLGCESGEVAPVLEWPLGGVFEGCPWLARVWAAKGSGVSLPLFLQFFIHGSSKFGGGQAALLSDKHRSSPSFHLVWDCNASYGGLPFQAAISTGCDDIIAGSTQFVRKVFVGMAVASDPKADAGIA